MLRIALATSLVALAPGPLVAQDHHGLSTSVGQGATYTSAHAADTVTRPSIVVSAPTLAVWSADLSRSLGTAMRYPRYASNELAAEGTAQVRFSCSDSGAPVGMELVRSSGDRRIDRAALDTVRRIKTLHPLPASMAHDQRYIAALVFATSQNSLKRQMKALRERPTMRADAGADRDIALVVAPRPTNG